MNRDKWGGAKQECLKKETKEAIKWPRRSEESQKEDIKGWRFRTSGEMFIYLLSVLKHKLIISHPAGAFGSPSSHFTVKDYGSLKRGTGSKQCVAMKNWDRQSSSGTERNALPWIKFQKTKTPSDTLTVNQSLVSHDSSGAITTCLPCKRQWGGAGGYGRGG